MPSLLPRFLRAGDYALPWQMAEIEKIALLQLLDAARPPIAIEIGTAQGGSLQALSDFAATVHSIDVDPGVAAKLQGRFPNVHFHTGASALLLPRILNSSAAQGGGLGFVLIDGDHSRKGVATDVNLLLQHVPERPVYVLLHDSFHPACRAGMLDASWHTCPYVHFVELDFVPGELFREAVDTAEPGSLWGGLAFALLLPEIRQEPLIVRQSRKGLFDLLCSRSLHARRRSLVRRCARKLKRIFFR